MRTTVTLDDDLVKEAEDLTGIKERSELIRKALRTLIEREAAQRLIQLGGSQPGLAYIPRRRSVL